MNLKPIFVMILAALTAACVSNEPAPKKIINYTPQDKITLTIPPISDLTDLNTISDNFQSGLSWVNYSSDRVFKYTGEWEFGKNTFKYTNNRCVRSKSGGGCSSIQKGHAFTEGSMSITQNQTNTVIELFPKNYDEETTVNFLTGNPDFPKFYAEAKDIVNTISNREYLYSFEVDSQYSTESILDNFNRLLTIYHGRDAKELKGNYDHIYVLKLDKKHWTTVSIKSFSYRNGSKTKVKMWLRPIVSGNNIDYSSLVNDFKEEVLRVVNS